jgi:hypothetical protein
MAGGTPLAVALAAVMLSIAHPDHGTGGELTNKQIVYKTWISVQVDDPISTNRAWDSC